MSPLEIALVILVSVWTFIFVIMAIAIVVLLRGLKQALDKINHILETGENMVEGVGAAASGVASLFTQRTAETMVKVVADKFLKRAKKS